MAPQVLLRTVMLMEAFLLLYLCNMTIIFPSQPLAIGERREPSLTPPASPLAQQLPFIACEMLLCVYVHAYTPFVCERAQRGRSGAAREEGQPARLPGKGERADCGVYGGRVGLPDCFLAFAFKLKPCPGEFFPR